jgi:hypothetical protein
MCDFLVESEVVSAMERLLMAGGVVPVRARNTVLARDVAADRSTNVRRSACSMTGCDL